ncbi:MAG: transglutaminase domain-containing protein [Longimicrobiales bacterium]|nr:transglutaminase domain-containing protein [Longimicrobiales bacterium]
MSRRRVLAALVIVSWLFMVGAHLRREYFQPELARLALAAMALNPGTNFYTLTMGGRSVGQATSALDTVPDGFLLEDLMSLELPALGQTGTAVARTSVRLDPSLLMRSFEFSLDSEVGRFQAEGTVEGDTLLRVTIRSQGSEQDVEFRLAQPPVFSAIVPIRLAMSGELEVGRSVRFPVFDPSSMSTRNVEVRVLEEDTLIFPDSAEVGPDGRWRTASQDTVVAWRIAELFGGISVESWIDEDGRTLRASSPLGFAMEKTEYELAQQAQNEARSMPTRGVDDDVILSTAIESNLDLSGVEAFDEVRFLLSGVDLEGFDLDGGRQELRGDTLIVRREAIGALDPGFTLPYPSMDLRDALQPEPLIQSAHPEIIRMAEEITTRRATWRQDPRRVATELNTAVFNMLRKEITFSVPSALQVLETRRGDCNEHTVLYVAMARALGLPARTAVGLVYTNGAFFYHAWPEVWLDGWVAMDPTFGQAPADAAHIRFVVGGLAQQVEIVRLIGNLDIEVLSIS